VQLPAIDFPMSTESARLRVKTWICASVVVLSNVFGNFFMKRGMPSELPSPLAYITALFQPSVSLGVVLLILWMLSRMALLSWADLSYVLPVTSVGYVLVALVGRVLLNEQITLQRWAGIVLIMAGVALVSGGSAPQTSRESASAGAAR
jgi:drug/metabolite transporter (DMT)-like permease